MNANKPGTLSILCRPIIRKTRYDRGRQREIQRLKMNGYSYIRLLSLFPIDDANNYGRGNKNEIEVN